MSIREDRRRDAIDRMADHLLRQGMAGASLRAFAAAAGTSDRMLLYYFADRAELLAATLQCVAHRLAARLDEALPLDGATGFAELLTGVWAVVQAPALQPFMHLWLELAAGAARAQQPHRTIAGHIADGFVGWLAGRLGGPADLAPPRAILMLAMIEGLLVLEAVGRPALAQTAATLLIDRFAGGAELLTRS